MENPDLRPSDNPNLFLRVSGQTLREVNAACTKWLVERGLYFDTEDWRELQWRRLRANKQIRQEFMHDDFIDRLNDQ